MRAVREQPRLVVAKALGMLCLVACGLVLGLLLGGDGRDAAAEQASRTAQLRLVATERTLRGESDQLRDTRALLARSRAVRARTRARFRAAQRENAELRSDLRRARRAAVRARARP